MKPTIRQRPQRIVYIMSHIRMTYHRVRLRARNQHLAKLRYDQKRNPKTTKQTRPNTWTLPREQRLPLQM